MKPAKRATAHLLWLAALGVLASFVNGFALPFHIFFVYLWFAAAVLLLLALSFDLFLLFRIKPPEFQRISPHTLPVGIPTEIQIRLHNPNNRTLHLELWDFHPASMTAADLPARASIPANQMLQLSYRLTPNERGYADFAPAQLLIHSPFRYWIRDLRIGQPQRVAVYPDFEAIAKYALLENQNQLNRIGIHKQRRRGEGRDFHQLREYIQGDPLRAIDWKSSSRLNKLITREYQEERDQKVVFLLDCGQSMRAKDGQLSHFDQALNAILLLAHVALKKGDEVGLVTFAGHERWLAPRKGQGQLRALLHHTFDLQPTTAAADFNSVASFTLSHQNKRALVVIITNLREEDCPELRQAALQLRRRHLVLIAGMREQVLETAIEQKIETLSDALRLASAHEYLQARGKALESLRRQGCFAIDSSPQNLPVALVNIYLEIKQRGAL